MSKQLELQEFLTQSFGELIIDVRTPLEYEQGHIIGSINLPLFTNEERVLVGTCYKKEGRQPAILLGFELIGDRWAHFIREAEKLSISKKIFVHCWRGGMRSGAMAWALSLYGFEVYVLKGGYKKYRQHALSILEKEYPFIILSGKTGSAKTATLHCMQAKGEQIIDLEKIANHQGSSFGSMGKEYQPSQEQFENLIAHELNKLDLSKRIWIENESIVIGKRVIPPIIFQQMRDTKIIDIVLPLQERVNFLVVEYGSLYKDFLKESVLKISKRLGPNETKLTLQAIEENRMADFIANVLVYYDKTYERGQGKRQPNTIHKLTIEQIEPAHTANKVIEHCNQLFDQQIEPFKNKMK